MEHLYLKWKQREWVYQVATLLLCAVIVHAIYTLAIRPTADATLELQEMQSTGMMQGANGMPHAPGWFAGVALVLKDYEQEACFIAMFWAFFIMLFKLGEIRNTRRLFVAAGRREQDNFLETQEGNVILAEAEDIQKYRAILQSANQQYGNNTLYRAASSCLERFFTTAQVSDATDALQQTCIMESERLETGLSIVRYLIWVIPSIGFIGTVRGIGNALGMAEEAVQGNIAPVTESLGTAFNSTLIALMISIVVMFLVHKLQESQESLILDVQEFCDKHLLRYLREKSPAAGRAGAEHGKSTATE